MDALFGSKKEKTPERVLDEDKRAPAKKVVKEKTPATIPEEKKSPLISVGARGGSGGASGTGSVKKVLGKHEEKKSNIRARLQMYESKYKSTSVETEKKEGEPAVEMEVEAKEKQPKADDSKPVTNDSKPVSIDYKPVKIDSKSVSIDSKPVKIDSKSVSIDSKPVSIDSKPVSIDSKPKTSDSKPKTSDTKLETATTVKKGSLLFEDDGDDLFGGSKGKKEEDRKDTFNAKHKKTSFFDDDELFLDKDDDKKPKESKSTSPAKEETANETEKKESPKRTPFTWEKEKEKVKDTLSSETPTSPAKEEKTAKEEDIPEWKKRLQEKRRKRAEAASTMPKPTEPTKTEAKEEELSDWQKRAQERKRLRAEAASSTTEKKSVSPKPEERVVSPKPSTESAKTETEEEDLPDWQKRVREWRRARAEAASSTAKKPSTVSTKPVTESKKPEVESKPKKKGIFDDDEPYVPSLGKTVTSPKPEPKVASPEPEKPVSSPEPVSSPKPKEPVSTSPKSVTPITTSPKPEKPVSSPEPMEVTSQESEVKKLDDKKKKERKRLRAEAASSTTEKRSISPKPTEPTKTKAKEEDIPEWKKRLQEKRRKRAEAASTMPKPTEPTKTETKEEELSDWQKRAQERKRLRVEAASSTTEKKSVLPKPEERVVSPKPSTESAKTETEEEDLPDWQKRVREWRRARAEAASSTAKKPSTVSMKPVIESKKPEVESKPKKKGIFDDDEPYVPSLGKTVTSLKPEPKVASPEPEKPVSSPEPVSSPKPKEPVSTSPKSVTPITTSPKPEIPVSSPEPMEVTSQESEVKKVDDKKKKERTNLFGEPLDTEMKMEVESQPQAAKGLFDEDEPYVPFRLRKKDQKKADALFADIESEPPKKMDTSEAVSPKASEEASLFTSDKALTKLFADVDEEPYIPFGLRRKAQKVSARTESKLTKSSSTDRKSKKDEGTKTDSLKRREAKKDEKRDEKSTSRRGGSGTPTSQCKQKKDGKEEEMPDWLKKVLERKKKRAEAASSTTEKKSISPKPTEQSNVETEKKEDEPDSLFNDIESEPPRKMDTGEAVSRKASEEVPLFTSDKASTKLFADGDEEPYIPFKLRRKAQKVSARTESKLTKSSSTDRKSKKDEGTKTDSLKRREAKKDEKRDEKSTSPRGGSGTPTSQRKQKKDGQEEEMPEWLKRVLERKKKRAEASSSATTGTKSPRLGQRSPNSSSATRSPSTGRRTYGSKATESEKARSPSASRKTRASDLSKSKTEAGSRFRDREKKEEKDKSSSKESSPSKKSDVMSPTRPKPKVAKKPSIEVVLRKSLSSTSSDKKDSVSESKSLSASEKKAETTSRAEVEDEVFLSNEKSASEKAKEKESGLALKRTPSPKLSIDLISTVLEPSTDKTEEEDSTDSSEKKEEKKTVEKEDSKKQEGTSEEEVITDIKKHPMSPVPPLVGKENSRQSSTSSDRDDSESRPFHSFSHSRSPTPTSSTGPLKVDNTAAVPEWRKKLMEKKKTGDSPSSSPAQRPRAATSAKTTKEPELPAWKKELLAKKKAVTGDDKPVRSSHSATVSSTARVSSPRFTASSQRGKDSEPPAFMKAFQMKKRSTEGMSKKTKKAITGDEKNFNTTSKAEVEDEVFLSNEKSASEKAKEKESGLALKRTPSPKLSIDLISTVLEPSTDKTEEEDSTDSSEKKEEKKTVEKEDSKKQEGTSEEEVITDTKKHPMSPVPPLVGKENSRQSSTSSDRDDSESRPFHSFSHSRSPTPTSSTGPLKVDNTAAVPEWRKKLMEKKKTGDSPSSSPAQRPRAATSAKTTKEPELPAWKKELLAKKKAVTGDDKPVRSSRSATVSSTARVSSPRFTASSQRGKDSEPPAFMKAFQMKKRSTEGMSKKTKKAITGDEKNFNTTSKAEVEDEVFLSNEKSASEKAKEKESGLALKRTPSPKLSIDLISTVLEPSTDKTEEEDSTDSSEKKEEKKTVEKEDSKKQEGTSEEEVITDTKKHPMSPVPPLVGKENSRQSSTSSDRDDSESRPFHSFSHSRSPTPTSSTGPLKVDNTAAVPEWRKKLMEKKKTGDSPSSSPAQRPRAATSAKTTKEPELPAWKKELLAKKKAVTGDDKPVRSSHSATVSSTARVSSPRFTASSQRGKDSEPPAFMKAFQMKKRSTEGMSKKTKKAITGDEKNFNTTSKAEVEDEVFLSNEKSASEKAKEKESGLALKRTPSPKLSIDLISTVLEPSTDKTEEEDSTDSSEKKEEKKTVEKEDSKKQEGTSEEEVTTDTKKHPMSPVPPLVGKENSRQSSTSSDRDDSESRPFHSFSHSRSPTPTSSTGPLKVDKTAAVPEWRKKLMEKKKTGDSPSSSPAQRPRAATSAKTTKEPELPAWKKELLAKKKAVTGDDKPVRSSHSATVSSTARVSSPRFTASSQRGKDSEPPAFMKAFQMKKRSTEGMSKKTKKASTGDEKPVQSRLSVEIAKLLEIDKLDSRSESLQITAVEERNGDDEDTVDKLSSSEAEHLSAVKQIMKKKGTLNHNISRGMMVGPARSGKSSLMSRLAGEMPSSTSPSTGVAEKVVQVVGVRKSHSVALSVHDTIWFKLLYDQEAIRLMALTTQSIPSQPQPAAPLTDSTVTSPPTMKKTTPLTEQPHEPGLSATVEILAPYPEGYIAPMEVFKGAIHEEGFELLRDNFENSWSFYLTDTGGQVEFQELIPLLVSGPSVFFFTFRLDQELDQRFTIEYHLPDGARSKPYQSTLTVVEAILQTLASVASMGVTNEAPQVKSTSLKPKMFIVGTHKDKLNAATADSEIKKIDEHLQKVIMSTSHYEEDIVQFASESQLIFTVNNFSEDDSDFKEIRSGVERVVSHNEFQVHFPTHWLIFNLVLRQEMIKDSIISYDECFSIAKDCGITDRDELNHALWFLHTKVGLIRHFPIPGLQDFVIRDPPILFDMVTKLIVDTFTFDNLRSKLRSSDFIKKGIFTLKDFEKVNKELCPMPPKYFMEILKQLQIVAPFQEEGQDKFFIPCVLAHSEGSKSPSLPQSSDVPPLLITFKCGYCPKGLTGALITYLLTNMMESRFKWELKTDQLFRNQISFLVSSCEVITLRIHPTFLELIHSSARKTTDDMGCVKQANTVCSKVCRYVENGIRSVSAKMNLTSKAEHILSFYCQNSDCAANQSPHPASKIVREDEDASHCGTLGHLWCKQQGKIEISDLPQHSSVWFKSEKQISSQSLSQQQDSQDWSSSKVTSNTCTKSTKRDREPQSHDTIDKEYPSKRVKTKVLTGNDFLQIYEYIDVIENSDIVCLGQALGLKRPTLKRSESKQLPGDMIDAWLRQDDDVMEESGPPTWESLCEALRKISHNGIATDIETKEKRNY